MNIFIAPCPDDKLRESFIEAQRFSDWLHRNFDAKEQWHTCIHEAGHLYTSRQLGIEPKLHGPMVRYRNGEFRRTLAAVEGPQDDFLFTIDPVQAAKFHICPGLISKHLTDRTDTQLIDDSRRDMADLRTFWTDRAMQSSDFRDLREGIIEDGYLVRKLFHQASEKSFHELLAATRESVLEDLKEDSFRQGIIETAREFQQKVFMTI